MPYNRLPRPRACPEGQLPNGSSIPDDGNLGAHNTDGVSSGLPTSQERGHGGDHPSCNNSTAVYRNFYGRARSPGATYYSFSWRLFDQWCTMGATSTSIGTTSYAAPTITPGLTTATTTATPAMPTTAMVAAGSENLPRAPGASK